MKDTLNIRSVFENENFQKIQDSLAIATGLAIITVDYKGIPITSHSSCSNFCKIMRKSNSFNKLCERCDSRGGLEAARTHTPYIYLCHAGLVDFAIPVISDNNYLGAILGGQVLLTKQEDNLKLEKICTNTDNTVSFENVNTFAAYRLIPTMSLDKIKIIADMLFSISRVLVDEQRLKFSINELVKNDSYIHVDEKFADTYYQIISNNYYDMIPEKKDSSSILKAAFDYIKMNLDGDLSLKKVSSVCNISPSYFSRLFSKESLGSYSNYINKLKINYAKRLLESTEMSINQISAKLGFDDCGYFIKVFKKFENTTPKLYRSKKNTSNKTQNSTI